MTALSGTLRPSPVLRRLLRSHASKRGLTPGTVQYTGEDRSGRAVHVWTFCYDRRALDEQEDITVDEACRLRRNSGVTWVLVDGVHDPAIIEALGDAYGLHRLVQEDIANTSQRAKLEAYEGYLYLVVPMVTFVADQGVLKVEQVSLVLGDDWVLAFLEDPGDVFDPVRNRLRAGGPVRDRTADHLLAALLDVIVDGYFVTLEALGDIMADLETLALERPHQSTQLALNSLRRELVLLRRAIWPVRESTMQLERTESPLVRDDTRPYLRDAYDHAVQALDITESLRDLASGLNDLYLSSLSNRMNEVMKVLAVVSAIFLPLTLISGIFGMNYHLPLQDHPAGFPMVMAVMGVAAFALVVTFRRKGWL